MNSNTRLIGALFALSLTAPLGTYANVLVNSGFENPTIANGTFGVYAGIQGWTATSGPGIEIQHHHPFGGSPFEGDQHVELDSFSNSSMEQVIPTTPGLYLLSLRYSPRYDVPDTSNGIEVYFNGTLLDTLATSGMGNADSVWTLHQYTVSAGPVSTVAFAAIGTSDGRGGYLDDIRLTAIPDTHNSSLLLFGAALPFLAWRRQR